MKINCIIIDDEQPAREIIEAFVDKVPYLDRIASFKNPLEAAGYLSDNKVDLVFLDIQMPEITGIEMIQSISQKPQVVLTTAYSEYALEGFELNATDYLLKPFSFERFLKAVHKVRERLPSASAHASNEPANTYITVNADHKIYKIKLEDIHYIEGLKEYVSYYTTDKQRIIALKSLKSLEESLPADQFIRVHRSYIVPLKKIESLEGNQLRVDGKLIPVGRSYREQVLQMVFDSH